MFLLPLPYHKHHHNLVHTHRGIYGSLSFQLVKSYKHFTRNVAGYLLRLILHYISHFFFFSAYKHSNSKRTKKISMCLFRQSVRLFWHLQSVLPSCFYNSLSIFTSSHASLLHFTTHISNGL